MVLQPFLSPAVDFYFTRQVAHIFGMSTVYVSCMHILVLWGLIIDWVISVGQGGVSIHDVSVACVLPIFQDHLLIGIFILLAFPGPTFPPLLSAILLPPFMLFSSFDVSFFRFPMECLASVQRSSHT